jgi:hypothetical protein
LVYIDDVIIYSKTEEEHVKHLDMFLETVSNAGYYIKPNKCKIFASKLQFLGHMISKDGIQPNPEKVKAIAEIPAMKNVKDVQVFLGGAGYYRRFIHKFALITSPLTELLKKDVKFEWTEKCQDALNKIKDMLMKHPILRFPDPTRRYYLQTDYSGEGISAVLSQLFEDGEHPTAYWSKANRGAQKKYPSTQGECYAVVQGMKHFRSYLLGNTFTVVTDHSALAFLMKTKGDTAQMFRWSLIIQEYMPFVLHGVKDESMEIVTCALLSAEII